MPPGRGRRATLQAASEIFYGQYDVETARLQEQLRAIRADLRLLQMDDKTFED